MKAHLMYSNRDFDSSADQCFNCGALSDDLGLERILKEMAENDGIVYDSCSAALFQPLLSQDEICYRQGNLRDALKNPDAVRKLYNITVETERKRKDSWYWVSPTLSLSSNYMRAVDLLKLYTEMLMQLRIVADDEIKNFKSEGFHNLFTMFRTEVSDDYIAEVRSHLNDLRDSDGILISASLGSYMQGVSYVLRRKNKKKFRLRRYTARSFTIAPGDDSGATDLKKRRERAVNEVTNALSQSAEHLKGFFNMLRRELAFYIGCLNLYDSLKEKDMPVCIPDLLPQTSCNRFCRGLYDISLALIKDTAVIGNNMNARGRRLYMITGANQGGKTTFLRSMGQAQLMAQCGMFTGAETFTAPVRNGIFTHFGREEDAAMKSGRLDEELSRMDEMAGHMQHGSMILFNESFTSTNEREGSEICRQITQALIENEIEVFSVTHLYTYAAAFPDNSAVEYMRAERLENGERTFRIVPGRPLKTAFVEDLYKEIFENNK